LALWEGYKFANGDLRRLTQPQLMFLDNFSRWKAEIKSGKTPTGGKPTKGMTPQQLHEKMWPKIQKQKKDGLDAEIAAADRVRAKWEAQHIPAAPKKTRR